MKAILLIPEAFKILCLDHILVFLLFVHRYENMSRVPNSGFLLVIERNPELIDPGTANDGKCRAVPVTSGWISDCIGFLLFDPAGVFYAILFL